MAKKFPDLTGDGKVTRADVLKGRGVYKSGGSVPKGMHRMPDGSLMKNSEHKEQAMRKPVKKFSGGLMRAVVAKAMPKIKEAVAGSGVPQEANPGVISSGRGRGLARRIATAMATASPQGGQPPARRGLFGRAITDVLAEATKRGITPPLPRSTMEETAVAAKKATGMKKGGVVTKKAVKKTIRKK